MRALDPTKTFEVTLPVDQDLPDADRPVYIGRYLTAAQFGDVAELLDQVRQASAVAPRIELYEQAVLIGLVGWRNVTDRDGRPMALGGDLKLRDVLTYDELGGLAYELVEHSRLSADQKKTSDSPCASATDSSAPGAAAAATPKEASAASA